MAAELAEGFGVTARLIRGGGGVFDVTMDDKLVFSKARVGRFPEPGEVEKTIRRLSSS